MREKSREKRARFTPEIQTELLSLVIKEQDYQRKKKHPARWYREQVANNLVLRDDINPTIRSYEQYLNDIRETLMKRDPMDQPWSIGSSRNWKDYGIDPRIVPVLIKIQEGQLNTGKLEDAEQLEKSIRRFARSTGRVYVGNGITNRDARWLSWIYPLIQRMGKDKGEVTDYCELKDEDEEKEPWPVMMWAYPIARVYSRLEQGHEIFNKEAQFDTRALDWYFFITKEFFQLDDGAKQQYLFNVAITMGEELYRRERIK
jgi:hypothetical protein